MRLREALPPILALATAATAQSLDPLKPLIVMINGDTQGAGIVFRLDENKRAWILTAHHVVAEKKSLTVRFFGQDDPVPATLRNEAKVDEDVAILTAPAPPNYTFSFTLTANPGEEGQSVRALGNPNGKPWTQTFNNSTIAAVGSSTIEIESPVITNGYSGGALTDAQGRLIGMILNTNGVTATALRIDRAIEILRRDLRLTVHLATNTTTVAPPKPPAELAPGTPRTNPKDGLVYRWIPPGTFMMGCSPDDNDCRPDEAKPPRSTNIPQGLWIGETEVTQAAYQKVIGANPSYFKGPQRPVEQIDWHQASAYCRAVGLRLPTEAEWEYAARAGSTTARYGKLADIAHTGASTADVGKKPPTPGDSATRSATSGNGWPTGTSPKRRVCCAGAAGTSIQRAPACRFAAGAFRRVVATTAGSVVPGNCANPRSAPSRGPVTPIQSIQQKCDIEKPSSSSPPSPTPKASTPSSPSS